MTCCCPDCENVRLLYYALQRCFLQGLVQPSPGLLDLGRCGRFTSGLMPKLSCSSCPGPAEWQQAVAARLAQQQQQQPAAAATPAAAAAAAAPGAAPGVAAAPQLAAGTAPRRGLPVPVAWVPPPLPCVGIGSTCNVCRSASGTPINIDYAVPAGQQGEQMISFEQYAKVQLPSLNEQGKPKYRVELVQMELPLSALWELFLEKLRAYLGHDLMVRWQHLQIRSMYTNLQKGQLLLDWDFSMRVQIRVPRPTQTMFFSGEAGMVTMLAILSCQLDPNQPGKLLKELHLVFSNSAEQSSGFAQAALRLVEANCCRTRAAQLACAPTYQACFDKVFVVADNCPGQNKSSWVFSYFSALAKERRMPISLHFYESKHGKREIDGQCASVKGFLALYDMRRVSKEPRLMPVLCTAKDKAAACAALVNKHLRVPQGASSASPAHAADVQLSCRYAYFLSQEDIDAYPKLDGTAQISGSRAFRAVDFDSNGRMFAAGRSSGCLPCMQGKRDQCLDLEHVAGGRSFRVWATGPNAEAEEVAEAAEAGAAGEEADAEEGAESAELMAAQVAALKHGDWVAVHATAASIDAEVVTTAAYAVVQVTSVRSGPGRLPKSNLTGFPAPAGSTVFRGAAAFMARDQQTEDGFLELPSTGLELLCFDSTAVLKVLKVHEVQREAAAAAAPAAGRHQTRFAMAAALCPVSTYYMSSGDHLELLDILRDDGAWDL